MLSRMCMPDPRRGVAERTVWFDLPPESWLAVPRDAGETWVSAAQTIFGVVQGIEESLIGAPRPRLVPDVERAYISQLTDTARSLPAGTHLLAALAIPSGLPQPVVVTVGYAEPDNSVEDLAAASPVVPVEPADVTKHDDGNGATAVLRHLGDDASIAVTVIMVRRTGSVDVRLVWRGTELALASTMSGLLHEAANSLKTGQDI